MAKQGASRQDAALPHVSLRQAVRPVIVAHGILSSEQLAAGDLADEAKALCDLTEELLRKLGRVHLLTASSAAPHGGPEHADTAHRLIEAYAQAGMSWARVLSSVKTLADLLIGEFDWATARLLATLLAEADETAVARHIESAVDEAMKTSFSAQIAAIVSHPEMSPREVRHAISVLTALPEHPHRKYTIRTRRVYLVQSLEKIARESDVHAAVVLAKDLQRKVNSLVEHPSLEDHPNYVLPESEFFGRILAILDLCGE